MVSMKYFALFVLAAVLALYADAAVSKTSHGSGIQKNEAVPKMKEIVEDVMIPEMGRSTTDTDSKETSKDEDDAEDAVLEEESSRMVEGVKPSTKTDLKTSSRGYYVSGYTTLYGSRWWRFRCHVSYARVVSSSGYCRFPRTLRLSGRYILVLRPCYRVRLFVRLYC